MRLSGYLAPTSADLAIAFLADNRSAHALAGGNSLLVEPNRSRMSGATLVDLRRIPGLDSIVRAGCSLRVGAMTSLGAISSHDVVRESYSALGDAARSVGDAQVRNRATIGGNMADNDPGADPLAALLALRAEIRLEGPGGSRLLAVDDFLLGPHETALGEAELITAIMLPASPSATGSAYVKFTHPATQYAICGVAACVGLEADGSVCACSVAVTGAAEWAARLHAVEQTVRGSRAEVAVLAEAADRAGEKLSFRCDNFASSEYRRHLTTVLTRRALNQAVARAKRSLLLTQTSTSTT